MTRLRERGFALLIVLWAVVFLSFLMTQIIGSGRVAISLAGNLRAAAQARAADDGAINEAVFHSLATGSAHWVAGDTYQLNIGALPVTVTIDNLAGMVNPNLASAALLSGLLQAVGVPSAQAGDLAGAIIAWRSPPASRAAGAATREDYRNAGAFYAPPARPFAAIGELGYVLGMTPDTLAQLTPHLSLYQPGAPNPKAADKLVRQALAYAKSADANGSTFQGTPLVGITACAAPPFALCRHAVVSLAGGNAPAAFHILALGATALGATAQ